MLHNQRAREPASEPEPEQKAEKRLSPHAKASNPAVRPKYRPDPHQKPESVSERSGFSTATTSPMLHIVRDTIAGMPSGGQIRQSLALAYWPRVVGALAARSS